MAGAGVTHIIISRVNIPRELDPSNHVRPAPYKSDEWNQKRIDLLNQFTRPSLRNQTCQDFIYVTLWGDHYEIDAENALDNELQIVIRRGYNELDEQPFDFEAWRNGEPLEKVTMDFAGQIRDELRKLFNPPVLITNIDSDDCLRYDFVEIIQQNARNYEPPVILDLSKRFMYNPDTGNTGMKVRSSPSPMTTSYENQIECLPLKYHHSMMLDYEDVEMVKIEGLLALQTVTDTNILTRGIGNRTDVNINEYF